MTNSTSSNKAVVPEAKSALDRFKFEVANELGVPLTDGYNGNLTSKQNGSVGGYMVKKMIESAGKTDVRKPGRPVLLKNRQRQRVSGIEHKFKNIKNFQTVGANPAPTFMCDAYLIRSLLLLFFRSCRCCS